MGGRPDPTELAVAASSGVPGAAERLLPLVYDDLRDRAAKAMARERSDHTLQPTALVHEAFARLVDQTRVDWKGRTHFLAVAATAMRRVLLDHARARARHKRAGGRGRVPLTEAAVAIGPDRTDLLALDEALRRLEGLDPRQAKVVELRFFGDLTVDQVAEVLGISARTVDAEWAHAKAWLRREVGGAGGPAGGG
jgi:RNA polymerase sigma factor (TIGR02999 family)